MPNTSVLAMISGSSTMNVSVAGESRSDQLANLVVAAATRLTLLAISMPPAVGAYQNEHGNGTVLPPGSKVTVVVEPGDAGGGGQLTVDVVVTVAAIFITLGTILGNSLVVLAVFTERRLRKVANSFLVSLALADLLVGLIVTPLALAYHLQGEWPWGTTLCDFHVSMDVTLCSASILHLCAISVDRYLAITNPLQYALKRTPRRAAITIVALWFLSFTIALPPLFVSREERAGGGTISQCLIWQNKIYTVFSTCVAFYIPLMVMLTVYCKIYRATLTRKKKWVSMPGSSHVVSRVDVDKEREQKKRKEMNMQDERSKGSSLESRSLEAPTSETLSHPRVQRHQSVACCLGEAKSSSLGGTKKGFTKSKSVSELFRRNCFSSGKSGDVVVPVNPHIGYRLAKLSSSLDSLPSMKFTKNRVASKEEEENLLISAEPPCIHLSCCEDEDDNGSGGVKCEVVEKLAQHQQCLDVIQTTLKELQTNNHNNNYRWQMISDTDTQRLHSPFRTNTTSDMFLQLPSYKHHNHSDMAKAVSADRLTSQVQGHNQGKGRGVRGHQGIMSVMQYHVSCTAALVKPRDVARGVEEVVHEKNLINQVLHQDSSCTDSPPSASFSSLTLPGSGDTTVPAGRSNSGGAASVIGFSLAGMSAGWASKRKKLRRRISMHQEARAARTLGIIMGCFVLCWLPFFVNALLAPLCASCRLPLTAELAFLWLGYANSALNPVIYTFFNRDFRRAFHKMLKCRCLTHRHRSKAVPNIDNAPVIVSTSSKAGVNHIHQVVKKYSSE